MTISTGFIFGIIGMIFFGLYGIPKKFVTMNQMEFMVDMGLGTAVSTTFIGLIMFPEPDMPLLGILIAYACGAIWYIATLSWVISIDYIGYGSSTAIKSLNGVFSTLYGIFLFQEYSGDNPVSLLFLTIGCFLMILSTVVLGRLIANDNQREVVPGNLLAYGILLAMIAALGHASYTLPWRMILSRSSWGWDFLQFTGQGIFLTAIIFNFNYSPVLKIKKYFSFSFKEHLLGICSGILFGIAFACIINSMNLVGIAVGMLLANMNIIVVLPISILFLKELNFQKEKCHIIVGMLAAFIGTVLLAISKA